MSSNSSESDDSYTSDNSDVNFKENYEFLEAEDPKDRDGEQTIEQDSFDPYADEPLADDDWLSK